MAPLRAYRQAQLSWKVVFLSLITFLSSSDMSDQFYDHLSPKENHYNDLKCTSLIWTVGGPVDLLQNFELTAQVCDCNEINPHSRQYVLPLLPLLCSCSSRTL